MASWWLLWEDMLFPEPGTEEKVIQRAKAFKAAGIDTVVIFGCHFRWDYIYNWERFHHLLKFIVDSCHTQGIKVFDHHSATLTHRVDTLGEYRNINEKNRHHVPFFPSREFADTITFNGNRLNDFRMISVQNGKPCYLDRYNAESFCINNPAFVDAYKKYVEKLLQTGIDGLMCDDVIYYPSWDGCGCDYCRNKFKDQYGHDLPPPTDDNFWGNYTSPAFKDWINMRYHDPLDFLAAVKKIIGADFPLMSCCSSSTAKGLDGSGMNSIIMVRAMNNVMLEMCGEIVSEEVGYSGRISDFMLHKAIADKHGYPSIGLGYAHNPDSAFVIWAFNKLFASSPWISTLTGRLGIAEEVRKTIPDEADIIQEAYEFEQQHEDLFRGKSSAKLAVLFSLDNLIYNGTAQDDYAQPWHDLSVEPFRQNIQFDVVLDIPSPDAYPVLLLSNLDCVSDKLGGQLLDYMNRGGTVIASGLLGFRDEHGQLREKPLMADMDIEIRNLKFNWNIPVADLFAGASVSQPDSDASKEDDVSYEVYHNETNVALDEWISVGKHNWLPTANRTSTIGKVREFLPTNDVEVSCPEGWIYRVLEDDGNYFVHLLALHIEATPYKTFRNTILNQPVIERLKFSADSGEVIIVSSTTQAVLYSPDLAESLNLERGKNGYMFKLGNIKRYLIVVLKKDTEK